MAENQKTLLDRQIPVYTVTINTSAFLMKQPSLKDKTQHEYLFEYWQKMGMDQKKISPSCQDRLSQLTTRQIDRIIDMQKIRSLLYDKKRKAQQIYFDNSSKNPGNHQNVYQANFLAKINSIAIKRNIRHQKSQGFDQYFGEELKKNKQNEKKLSAVPYKYIKKYQLNHKFAGKCRTHYAEDDDQKSIASIDDNLDIFQEKLNISKMRKERPSRNKRRTTVDCKLMPSKRWFYGMSNLFLDRSTPQIERKKQIERVKGYDIQGQVSLRNSRGHSQIITAKSSKGTKFRMTIGNYGSSEPLSKYKISRVTTLA